MHEVVHVSRKPRLQAYTGLSMAEATCISKRQVSSKRRGGCVMRPRGSRPVSERQSWRAGTGGPGTAKG